MDTITRTASFVMSSKQKQGGSAWHRAWLTAALWLASCVVLLMGLTACGGSDSPSTPITAVSALIGPAGGTVTGPDGVQVVIPANALNQDTTIGVARTSAGAPTTLPEDITAAGSIYEFTPHDVTFNAPVIIRMPVPANAVGADALMASPGGDWQVQAATVTGQMAEWQRNSFSWGFYGYDCTPTNRAPYSNSNPDPYPCWPGPSGGTDASATPASAITRTAFAWPSSYSGTAGAWTVNQASTVQLTVRYAAVPDCENARVKLIRWNPAVPLNTPGRVQTLFDQSVTITPTTFPMPGGIGTYVRAVGTTTKDIAFSHLDNGTTAFGFSFSCNRPFRTARTGGDISTFVVSIPVPTITHTIGGTLSGLTGTGLVLQNNGTNFTPVAANGSFSFSSAVGAGAPYNVTVLTQPTGQTCTVTNGSGTANADISNVAVNCITSYSIGGTVTGMAGTGLVLQNNGADNLTVNASGAFSFLTPVAAAGAYSVTVLTQPSGSTCTVTNGSGTANATVNNVVVACASAGSLALVANSGVTNGTNGLSVYRVNPSTGDLSFLNNVNAGNTPWAVAISPNGLYAYVSNAIGGTLSSYSIDSANGVLSPIPLSSPGSNNVFSIAMDRLGRFLWTANYGFHTVSAFSIGSNGVLTPVGSPLATTSLPYAITAHPTKDFVYVAHDSSNHAMSVYSVNPATGALTLQQTLTNVIVSPSGMVIDPSGQFAYAVSQSGGISEFRINTITGLLTYIGAISTGGATFAIAAHPNGQYVYVTNGSSSINNVVVFAINPSTGALTQVGSPYSAGSNPRGVTINAAGTYLYVTNYSTNNVSAFSISGAGATLTPLGSTVATGIQPVGIAIAP